MSGGARDSGNGSGSGSGGTLSPRGGSGFHGSFSNSFGRGERPPGLQDLANAAREQMQNLFGRPSATTSTVQRSAERPTVLPTAAPEADGKGAAAGSSPSPLDISPSNSLSEALYVDEEDSPLTFARSGSGSERRVALHSPQHSPRHCTEALDHGAGVDIPHSKPGAKAGEGKQLPFGSPTDSSGVGFDARLGAEASNYSATAPSTPGVVHGLRQLLPEEDKLAAAIAHRRDSMRRRTSAGIAHLESMGLLGTLSIAAAAAAALAIGHGSALLAWLAWLLWSHGADVVAGCCIVVLALKLALATKLDVKLHGFLAGFEDLQASVHTVQAMQEDVHTMRLIIEHMQADLDAKTAWIPTSMKPPTWLPGQKRSAS